MIQQTLTHASFYKSLIPDSNFPEEPYFVFGIPEFIAGVLCFFLADWIVKLAYRDPSA
jgi:hypothetical protein